MTGVKPDLNLFHAVHFPLCNRSQVVVLLAEPSRLGERRVGSMDDVIEFLQVRGQPHRVSLLSPPAVDLPKKRSEVLGDSFSEGVAVCAL
jgi:hypothetical protein